MPARTRVARISGRSCPPPQITSPMTDSAQRGHLLSRAILAASALLAIPAAAQHSPCVSSCADVAVVHATVWTGVRGAADARAVAARGGRIIAVGSDADVNRVIGPRTRIVDAGGKLLVPGFIDSHVHFITGGAALSSVQL